MATYRIVVLFLVLCAAHAAIANQDGSCISRKAREAMSRPTLPDDANAGVPTPMFGPAGMAMPGAAGFPTELEAVIAAVAIFNPASIREDREYLGGILESGRHYYYTVSPGTRGADRVSARIRLLPAYTVVAFWHTHGAAAPERRYFSEIDTELVRNSDRPFYLGDPTGLLKVYSPGDSTLSAGRAHMLGLPRRSGYAAGTTVRDPDGRVVEIDTRSPGELAAVADPDA